MHEGKRRNTGLKKTLKKVFLPSRKAIAKSRIIFSVFHVLYYI